MKAREIDRRPEPLSRLKMKVIVASPSRSGTLALHKALKILGYKSYHFSESLHATPRGLSDIRIANEAFVSEMNFQSGRKPYDEEDIRKWFADYECIVEMCGLVGNIPQAYLSDPDVKFILTERDSTKWAKSINTTAGSHFKAIKRFPANILRHFNPFVGAFTDLTETAYLGWSKGTWPGSPGNEECLKRTYEDHIQLMKDTIPADRLKVIPLQDGVGWNDICSFLGKEVPDEPYPGRNTPEELVPLVMGFLGPCVKDALRKLGFTVAVAVGVLGVGLWRLRMRYW